MNPKLPPLLVVDDSPDDTFLLKRLLVKGGVEHPMLCTEDGAGAQPILRAGKEEIALRPIVVFTDLKMPVINGIELTRWIRQQPHLTHLPVVMVTSSGEDRDVEQAKRVGVTAYFQKFPLPSTLAQLIRDAESWNDRSVLSPAPDEARLF